MQPRSPSKSLNASCGAAPPRGRGKKHRAKSQSFPDWALAIAACVAAVFSPVLSCPSHAEDAEISSRRTSERLSFSDSEIAEGFFQVAFGAELQFGPREERIRKFDEPVRVFIDQRGGPSRRDEIAAVVADIRDHVSYLDFALTDDRKASNLIVTIVRERDLGRTLAARFGRKKAKKIKRSLDPVCLSGIRKDETYRIRHAEVFLPSDSSGFTFYDCAYEELLQALGPINDSASIPWTMFNDKTQMGFFDRYDQYLLNILYDPRILPGMTKEEVRRLLPEIMPAVRARVTGSNRKER